MYLNIYESCGFKIQAFHEIFVILNDKYFMKCLNFEAANRKSELVDI